VHPRGDHVGGLLRYLFGPGKREEHVRPRLVAAWDGAGPLAVLQPPELPVQHATGGRVRPRRHRYRGRSSSPLIAVYLLRDLHFSPFSSAESVFG
jgi:hypothetical protein